MEIWPKFGRNTLLHKSISTFIALSFILSSIAFADPVQNKLDIPQKNQSLTSPNNIEIEKEYGLVKSKFLGNSNKLIINIQDAHCNYEAQTNIINILETLIKGHSLSLISVEGADGLIDTTWFKAFPDEEVRKEVATYFMKKGEITGPEFLSITKNYPIKLFGAEDRAAYIQNLNAFTSSYPLKAETEKYYNSIKAALNRLKGYIYSEDLKAMDAKSSDYESKKIQFNDYIRFLQTMAEKEKVNLRSYSDLFKLVSVLTYEKKIDFNVTDKERASLIDELSKMVSKDALTDLVSQSIAFKSGKISSAEFYAGLKKLAVANDIDMSKKYPNLYNYIIYNSVYSRIDNEKLFNDIKKIETDIKEKLFTSDDQRALDKLSRHIDILLGMVNIKLLNGDFTYYKEHKDEFSHEAFISFIKKEGEKFGLAYDVEPPSDAVAESIPKLEDFYAIATTRDKALVDNTIKEMDREKQQIAVLVTGGFHSEGMAKLLEKQGVSYIVVCPSITKDVPTPYIQILTNQRTPIEDILTSPDASKKGMLAPISRTELATVTPAQLKAFLQNVPVADDTTKELIGRIIGTSVEFREGWLLMAMKTWIRLILARNPNHILIRDKNVMKDAYKTGMRLSIAACLREKAGLKPGENGGEKGAEISRQTNQIVEAITTTAEFTTIFDKAFVNVMPAICVGAIGANDATAGGNGIDNSVREKSVGATLTDSVIDAVIANPETQKILIFRDGVIPESARRDYPQYADLVDILRSAIIQLDDDVFSEILHSPHVNDMPLESIFTRNNLLRLLRPGSGLEIVLVQAKDAVSGVHTPGIIMKATGSNYGHYSTKNRRLYLPKELMDIMLKRRVAKEGQRETDKLIAAEMGHELSEYLVLAAIEDPANRTSFVESRDSKGVEAHFIAQLLERALTGPSAFDRETVVGLHSRLDDMLDEITMNYFTDLAAALKPPQTIFSDENRALLRKAAEVFSLQPTDEGYLAQLWSQYLVRQLGVGKLPVKIIKKRPEFNAKLKSGGYDPTRDGNFIFASMLTPWERQTLLGSFSYSQLAADRTGMELTRDAVITLNSLDGGIGEAVQRKEELQERARKEGRSEDEVELAAKGTDVGYDLGYYVDSGFSGVKQLEEPFVSIAEMKLLQLIRIAQMKKYGAIRFRPLVNHQSAKSYNRLLASACLYDRFDNSILEDRRRTYRQIMEESGIEILPMVFQADLPFVEKKTGNLTLNNKACQPGGHGQFGFKFLVDAYREEPPQDGKTYISVFYNGDNTNSRPDDNITRAMIKKKMPIVKLTTVSTASDKKGGKDGVRVEMVNGKPIYVPDQMEVADAKSAGQYDDFEKAGLYGGLGEPGTQPFNTNIFYLNTTLLHQIMREMVERGVTTEEGMMDIISPTLIDKPLKVGGDGTEYVPLDGAIGVAMNNLNAFYMTSTNPAMKDIRGKYGDRLLYFVDIPRTDFFTPVKATSDAWLLNSDYYAIDTTRWVLHDSSAELVPPDIDVIYKVKVVENGVTREVETHWADVARFKRSFSHAHIAALDSLKIRGKDGNDPTGGAVLLRGAELIGKVEIINKTGRIIDLNSRPELLTTKGTLVLRNVRVIIDENNKIKVERLAPDMAVVEMRETRQHEAAVQLDKLREMLADGGTYDLTELSARFGLPIPTLAQNIQYWGKKHVWPTTDGGWFSYVQLADEAGRLTDMIAPFDKVHAEGLMHHRAAVLMIAPDGKYAIQTRREAAVPQRQDITVSEHPQIGETPEATAIRGIHEEARLTGDLNHRLFNSTNLLSHDGKFRKTGRHDAQGSSYETDGTYHSHSEEISTREFVDFFVLFLNKEEAHQLELAQTEEVAGFNFIEPESLFSQLDNLEERPLFASAIRQFFEGPEMRKNIVSQIEKSRRLLPGASGAMRANGGELTLAEHRGKSGKDSEGEASVNSAIKDLVSQVGADGYSKNAYSVGRSVGQSPAITDVKIKTLKWEGADRFSGITKDNFIKVVDRLAPLPQNRYRVLLLNLIVIKGLKDKLLQMGVAPDLILHPGYSRGAAYIDEDDFIYLLSLPNGVDLIEEALLHEMEHNRNPQASEEEIEVRATSKNVREALAAKGAGEIRPEQLKTKDQCIQALRYGIRVVEITTSNNVYQRAGKILKEAMAAILEGREPLPAGAEGWQKFLRYSEDATAYRCIFDVHSMLGDLYYSHSMELERLSPTANQNNGIGAIRSEKGNLPAGFEWIDEEHVGRVCRKIAGIGEPVSTVEYFQNPADGTWTAFAGGLQATAAARIDVSKLVADELKAYTLKNTGVPAAALAKLNQFIGPAASGVEEYLYNQYAGNNITAEKYSDSLKNIIPNIIEWYLDEGISDLTKKGIEDAIAAKRWEDIATAFSENLRFGTAGLRGKFALGNDFDSMATAAKDGKGLTVPILKGPATFNDEVVSKFTVGLLKWRAQHKDKPVSEIALAVAYDSRIAGQEFADLVKNLGVAFGVRVFISDEAMPLPEFSCAMKALKLDIGIFVSASHNGKAYNGVKIIGPDGAQLGADDKVREAVIGSFKDTTFKEASDLLTRLPSTIPAGQVTYMGADKKLSGKNYGNHRLVNTHLIHEKSVFEHMQDAATMSANASKLNILQCPFYGAGRKAMPRMLSEKGFNVESVKGMYELDGTFPALDTIKDKDLRVPDPALVAPWQVALNMYMAENDREKLLQKDLIFGSDPDADRFGLIVRIPVNEVPANQELAESMGIVLTLTAEEQAKYGFGAFKVVSPNEWGAIIDWYDLNKMKAEGKLDARHSLAWSHVTSDVYKRLVDYFGIRGKVLPVGVDQIAQYIANEEAEGRIVLGGHEESGTYATSDHVRDKDGFLAGMRLAEIACSALAEGKTLNDLLNEIALQPKIGFFATINKPLEFEANVPGKAKKSAAIRWVQNVVMPSILERIGRGERVVIGGEQIYGVDEQSEYRSGKYDKDEGANFPDAGVRFYLSEDKLNYITIRPSGTEPKIRFYVQISENIAKGASVKELALRKQAAYSRASNIAAAWLKIVQSKRIEDQQLEVESVMQEFRRFSSLPVSVKNLPQVSAEGKTPSEFWSEVFSSVTFDNTVYRRVEQEGDATKEQSTGTPAFKSVEEDTDIKPLMVYSEDTAPGIVREGEKMRGVLMDENAPVTPKAYFMYRGVFASKADIEKAFYDQKIRYDVTIIPPAQWGKEPAKTFGHYHSPVDKPEIYQVLSGEAIYFLQKCNEGEVVDAIMVKAKAGDIVIMLPGYGHVSMNTSPNKPLVMANWLTWNQKSYYGSFGKNRGAVYYAARGENGEIVMTPNRNYKNIPPLRQMAPANSIPAFGLKRGEPIYDLVKKPDFAKFVEFLRVPQKYTNELTPETTLQSVAPADVVKVEPANNATTSVTPAEPKAQEAEAPVNADVGRLASEMVSKTQVAGPHVEQLILGLAREGTELLSAMTDIEKKEVAGEKVRQVVLLRDSELYPTGLAHSADDAVKKYLGGALIDVPGKGLGLWERGRAVVADLIAGGKVEGKDFVVVTLTGNNTLAAIAGTNDLTPDSLRDNARVKDLGKVLSIQTDEGRLVPPIIGLYAVVLRIANDTGNENILRCLNSIAWNGRQDHPFTPDDLAKGVLVILPKIAPVSLSEAMEEVKAAEKVLQAL